ncbi:CocE/NonD family hydrolase [Mucilaginibacter sp.]|uniref:CocE/NonD family hydrolase n=1 Tax=Mucilaginibacter sp. TaxID=1882438 RepID=UPI00283D7CC3|nr:CocE/NonD family hydrolase [Mucilaginibacter sp.]MDR3695432.1 CocE/NonD family hydrolase [Mucilaginibacter sp.]
MKKLIFSALGLCLFALSSLAQPGGADAAYVKDNYTKYEYEVPMRDGIKLFTSVYEPKDTSKKYPIMMDRTPYSIAPYGADKYKGSLGPSPLFLHDKYIFVYQDVRGRWMSEGTFREMTPELEQHKTNKDVDEGTDTYDTIDWLIKNIPNNTGKVGAWGISYPGFFTTTCLLSRHPALVAASPQAPMSDLYRDDAFHNGAFMLAANFSFYPFFTNRQDDKPTQARGSELKYGTEDGYEYYMKMGSVKNSNKPQYYNDTIRLWNEMLDHPNYDQHWKDRNVLPHLHDIKTATLVTGGWYDAEDLYGAINTYKTLVKDNPNTPIYFAMGPWVHGGWARGAGDHLGDVDFGGPTGPFYREKIEFAFFSHYLKGTDADIPKVSTFETGINQWKTYKTWPPKEAEDKNLYLLPGGKLSFDAPKAVVGADSFISDPNKPVPFINSTDLDMKREYMTGDQRFAESRPDVLTYQTDVLDKDITLAGNIWANLKVSTSGTDADWVVKVIDVYPDSAKNNKFTGQGVYMSHYEQMVRSEAMRGKFRKSFEFPVAFTPGQLSPVNFELQDVLHTFKKGHRIMVQIQSTWFPLIDRNPQRFEDIMKAKDTDFQKATNKVYSTKDNPSYLKVRVMPAE